MEIQELDRAQLHLAEAVLHRAFADVAEKFGLTQSNCPTNPAFITTERLINEADNGIAQYGIWENGTLCGFFGIERREDWIELTHLGVVPEFRHGGFGAAAVEFAKVHARRLGYKALRIGIIAENSVLKDWYARAGFAETRSQRFPQLPFTVCIMEAQTDIP
ncbi:MAG: GNAT family N-acetyltransferase [Oscillospiraceae bacterium]